MLWNGRLERDIKEHVQQKQARLYDLCQNWAGQMEGYAKQYASWTDRTSHARQSLHGGVTQASENELRLYLSHGVEYGIWLEKAHGGNYSIVRPTVDVHFRRIEKAVIDYWRG